MPPRRRSLEATLALAVLATVSSACGGRAAREAAPTAVLAESLSAQERYRALRAAWLERPRAERAGLEAEFREFARRFASDPLARGARAHLAWIAVEKGELAAARALADEVAVGSRGTLRDFGDVLAAAATRRQGDAAGALARLAPLVGKIIDPQARELYAEEIVGAAMDAGRHFEAVAYMDLWLRSTDDDGRDAVRHAVEAELARVPIEALEAVLRAMREGESQGGYGDETRRLVASRLAALALERSDARLARRLLDASRAAPVARREDLADLASAGGAARVEGRVVGLVLALGSREQRERTAAVLSGVVAALGLPGEQGASADGVRLATRDDGGDPTRTAARLDELAALGASVVVAGIDAAQATAAVAHLANGSLPAVLVEPPSEPASAASPIFVLEDANAPARERLAAALADRGARSIALVGPGVTAEGAPPGACADVDSPAVPRFPVAAWRTARIDGVLVSADATCAVDLARALRAARLSPTVALGLEASRDARAGVARRALFVASGRYPFAPDDAVAVAWRARHAALPSFREASAHDAAALAAAALAEVPERTTRATPDVAAHHRAVASALATAVADLWTTASRGFGGARELARPISVEEAP